MKKENTNDKSLDSSAPRGKAGQLCAWNEPTSMVLHLVLHAERLLTFMNRFCLRTSKPDTLKWTNAFWSHHHYETESTVSSHGQATYLFSHLLFLFYRFSTCQLMTPMSSQCRFFTGTRILGSESMQFRLKCSEPALWMRTEPVLCWRETSFSYLNIRINTDIFLSKSIYTITVCSLTLKVTNTCIKYEKRELEGEV